ncbi:FAS1-like dehydratase domain-containing protein [Nocardioides sp. GXZ039]|uniref:FAS1-like dehydratase domain-containing protein n=1 Tax=Nocardioides sp. GXZ039 TaxID=3136018 RepID=UPI0030F45138
MSQPPASPPTAGVGDQITYPVFHVTCTDIARFAHSIGSRAPEYFDAGAARSRGHRDVVAPLGYYVAIRHQTASLVALEELSVDGMPPDLTPATTYLRRAAGESRARFHDRFVAGDRVVVTKTLVDIADKQGRSGAFTAVTHELHYDTDRGTAVVEHFVRILR